MNVLPDNILRCMRKEDRPKGPEGMTSSEAQERWQTTEERKMHETFGQYLRLRDIFHIHSRMDKRPTITKGWPDFTIIHGSKVALVEFKAEGGSLSKEQAEIIGKLEQQKTPVKVCRSAQEAIEWVKGVLDL